MKTHYNIIIAGAGGIAEAAGLILAEWSQVTPTIYIGNRTLTKAEKVANWIMNGSAKPCKVVGFHLDPLEISDHAKTIFENADALLDCLPGSLAPTMAKLANANNLYYANLTEYVAETNQIIDLAKHAKTGFVLQTGLAPGYIDVLAHFMYQEFCKQHEVDRVEKLELKVGALTNHAIAPHFYGFTWSPVGVATEYLKDCIVIRDYKKASRPALSERSRIIINGITYEDDLTSGGAADLPDALSGKVKHLDYKTLRHPGHYAWIENQLKGLKSTDNPISELQDIMINNIPNVEDDQIIIYAAVEGKDAKGILRRQERANYIKPQQVGKHTLRAIQTTTAAPLVQSIQWLLETQPKGVILQSQLDAKSFLNGSFITPVYGSIA
ncbi:saccharopine dehydrogenase [Algibacter amylolyticus]|uniref:Saccharopine dehydrogenase n=1 Tax=Algibacter amylolyticus TaxID=1608400 RepID=A0A5M7AX20_9FLAO|nr:saccharopine dehydrogenase C-terminal domain-containing protein [Algibacter amylolyticus]KAA5821842.1 saccharopine dehydrogenase [Algibacter amylolyticus]MBB5269361.1 saccharopine dehydrogenase-like NADP-dependent oxidoreductase [Algibacter amylolyticus]TSJ73126.1 saccharopine dehydrogenase [Algibacter amylolyticus]